MRRLAIASLACLFALSAPALAQARSKHAGHHHRGHTRIVHLRPASKSSTKTPASEGSGTETAGSVASFEEGVLTLTLNKGSVSGLVTEQTEIKCESGTQMAHAADHGGAGDSNSSSGDSHGSSGDEGASGQPPENGDDNGQGDDDQEEHGEAGRCGTSSLVPGALVREAELRVGPSGAVFKEIELVG